MTVSTANLQRLAVLVVVLVFWIGKSVWREDQWILLGSHNAVTGEQHPHLSDFTNFLVHIPKSGGSFAFDKLIELLVSSKQWKDLPVQDRWMICDGRTRPTKQFETHYPYTSQQHRYNQYPCNFWMAEQPYTTKARANYVIVRSPRSHILSQYFHCKESINHYDRWKYMPSLTEWLQAWVDAMDNSALVKENQKFHCFDPRNLQSRFAGTYVDVNSNSNNNNNNNSTAAEKGLPDMAQLEQQLQDHFVVVGDNARMHTSVCMIFIRYTGGWIPPSCDCGSTTTTPNQQHHRRTKTMTTMVPKTTTMDNNIDYYYYDHDHYHYHRHLKIHLYGHGVRHHGSSYPTTPEQDALLARLINQDVRLYQAVQTVIDKQLQDLQEEYGIRICDKSPK